MRYPFTRFEPNKGHVPDYDLARRRFAEEAYVDERNVVRWKSNNSVPPKEIVSAWAALDLPFDAEASLRARDGEISAFIEEYRRTYQGPSAEERAEARAAFGPGVELVNVVTGHRWTT